MSGTVTSVQEVKMDIKEPDMAETLQSASAQEVRVEVQEPGSDGGQSCAPLRACWQSMVCWCKARCPWYFTPKCANRRAFLFEIIGIAGLFSNLAMLGDVDDILKCRFTSGTYFVGIALSAFFFVATTSRLCGYKGFFNAHPICRASSFLHTYCRGDGCDGMTGLREGDFQDRHVLAYIYMNAVLPSQLIAFAASYLNHVQGYAKYVGLKIEHPAILWLVIIANPAVVLTQAIWAAYNVYSKDGCSLLFKRVLMVGIIYVVELVILYSVAFGHVLDDVVCPRYRVPNPTMSTAVLNESGS